MNLAQAPPGNWTDEMQQAILHHPHAAWELSRLGAKVGFKALAAIPIAYALWASSKHTKAPAVSSEQVSEMVEQVLRGASADAVITETSDIVRSGRVSTSLANTIGKLSYASDPLRNLMFGDKGFETLAPHEAQAELDHMRKVYPHQLKGVKVRLGGENFLSDLGQIYRNPDITKPYKAAALVMSPFDSLKGALGRKSRFSYGSKTVTLYNKSPEYLQHLLGDAAAVGPQNDTPEEHRAAASRALAAKLLAGSKLRRNIQANVMSAKALESRYGKNTPEHKEALARRAELLGPLVAGDATLDASSGIMDLPDIPAIAHGSLAPALALQAAMQAKARGSEEAARLRKEAAKLRKKR